MLIELPDCVRPLSGMMVYVCYRRRADVRPEMLSLPVVWVWAYPLDAIRFPQGIHNHHPNDNVGLRGLVWVPTWDFMVVQPYNFGSSDIRVGERLNGHGAQPAG